MLHTMVGAVQLQWFRPQSRYTLKPLDLKKYPGKITLIRCYQLKQILSSYHTSYWSKFLLYDARSLKSNTRLPPLHPILALARSEGILLSMSLSYLLGTQQQSEAQWSHLLFMDGIFVPSIQTEWGCLHWHQINGKRELFRGAYSAIRHIVGKLEHV